MLQLLHPRCFVTAIDHPAAAAAGIRWPALRTVHVKDMHIKLIGISAAPIGMWAYLSLPVYVGPVMEGWPAYRVHPALAQCQQRPTPAATPPTPLQPSMDMWV